MNKWRVILSWSLGIFFILFTGSIILNSAFQNILHKKIKKFSPHLQIDFSSLNTSLFTESIQLNNVNIQYKPDNNDQQHQDTFYFSKVKLSGINFLKMLFSKNISINKLQIGNGNIKLDQFLLNKNDTALKSLINQIPFKNIHISHFNFAQTNIWLHSDKENYLLLKGEAAIDEININDPKKPLNENNFKFSAIETRLSDINYYIADIAGTLQLKSLKISSKRQLIQIDALKITSRNSKSQFYKIENQPAGIEANISGITIMKLDFSKLVAKKFIAGKIVFDKARVIFLSKSTKSSNLQHPSMQSFKIDKLPGEIKIDSIKIDHPSFVYENFTKEDIAKTNFSCSLLDEKNVLVKNFQIVEAAVAMRVNNTNQLSLKASINIDQIKTDSLTPSFKSINFHFDQINCTLSEIKYVIPNTYFEVQIKKLLFDSKRQVLQIDFLKIISQQSKFELGRKLLHQADYIDAAVQSIKMKNLDVMKLFSKQLIADDISINEVKLYIFRDRRLPRLLLQQPLPVAYLKKLPVEIRVKAFEVLNSSAEYEEFPKGGIKAGTLKIDNVHAVLSPLINRPKKSDPDYMNMDITGSIMGSGAINAAIHLPLRSQQYSVNGAIENLDLSNLNSAAENLGKFHIESGMLNILRFQFNFDKEKATGKIVGEYHNLIIDKLKGNDKKIARIPSLILKKLIIPKNKDQSISVSKRTGKIDYRRDPTRFVSFYLLKALLTGIKASFTFGFLLPG